MNQVEQIARICHEVNRVYCLILGDGTQLVWDAALDWQKQSAIKGVEFALSNPNASPSAQHESWLAEKERDGWKYGPVKDTVKKEHPCFVPYQQLPKEQQFKDLFFKVIVNSFQLEGVK